MTSYWFYCISKNIHFISNKINKCKTSNTYAYYYNKRYFSPYPLYYNVKIDINKLFN